MKTVSEGFKTETKSYARNELVKFIEKGTNNVIDGEYIVDGFLQEISYADDTLVGNTPAKNLEVNILNPNSVEYMGKEIEVYTGLTVNGQQEFVKHGTFIIDSSEEDVAKGTVKVTALDYMIKFNKTFVDELDWSVTRTLREFAEYVCEKCNMTLSSKAFPNDSYVLTEQPAFEGYSCRYVLGKIAEIAGSIAIINENDEAEIKPLTISNEYEDILVDSIMAMEVSETTYLPYNAVMISLAEGVEGENVTQRDEVSIEAYGERCLKIANNEFAINETVRQNLIEAIFSSINGFFYIPMSITYNSYDWLTRLDKIHVYYDDEHYYETYLLNHTIEFPSSISSTIACESKSTTNTSFEYVPVAEQKQAHTEIVVDKLNKKITSTVEEVNSQSEKISQVTQNLESVNLSISNVEKGVASLETNLATTNKNLASTNQTVTDLEGDVDALSADLNGVSQDFADFKDNEYVQSIENLQNQIDGAIQFWNGADIPTLSNYPANEWTTEADKNNHRADIYTVIKDVDGVMKQGKSYRFDKVNGVWQWIELTDNELSAVQEIAQNALKQANTNATDITTLKQTDTEIKASIEGIQLNYNTLNNQFDATVITSKTVEGNPIHITDAGDYDLDRLYLEGNSYQETEPTPDTPQEIEVIEGSVDVEVVWKNLFDINSCLIGQIISSTGTISTSTDWNTSNLIEVSSNQTYSISFTSTSLSNILITEYNENEEFIQIKQINSLTTGTTHTSSATTKYIRFSYRNDVGIENIQIEEGSATEYEAYKSTTTSLDLQGNFLAKIGDVKDELDVVSGKLIKRIGKVVLNGSESWQVASTVVEGTTRFYYENEKVYANPLTTSTDIYVKSDKFINTYWRGIYDKDTTSKNLISNWNNDTDTNGRIVIRIDNNYASDVATFKTWLASNNVEVYYVLAEPYEVQLDNTAIRLNLGVNNIYINTNLDPSYINLTYLTDSVLNSQYATQTQLQLTKDSITSVVKDTTTLNANLTDLQSLVSIETTDLKNALGDLTNDLEENYATNDSVLTVSNSVTNIQTSLNQQIEITKDIQVNGVSKVKTTTGFTFDENGLTIEKTNADTKTNIDEDGMVVYSTTGSKNTEMLVVDSQGVEAENVTVRTYLVVGQNSRFQDYETGTGCFYVGE